MRSGLGTSELDDSVEAGRQAARAAVAMLSGEPPALVLVYASVRYDLRSLLGAIREETGDVPLAGASSSGHFHNGGITPPGAGVAVLVLSAGRYRFGVGAVAGLREDPFATGRELVRVASSAAGDPLQYSGVILLSCGLVCDQQNLLNGVHRVTGAGVPVVGGVASDDRRMRETFVFHDGEVLTNAAVAVWISSERPLRVVHGHGWRPLGLPRLVTGVDGPIVRTIAGRPAIEVFQENLREAQTPGDLTPIEEGGRHAADGVVRLGEVGRAFGLVEPDGGLRMRGVFIDKRGEIRTLALVPPYSAVQVMACTQDDLLGVCDKVAENAVAGRDARVLLSFSCVARYEMLRERAAEESLRLHEGARGAHTFGFYTYGEFARTTSVSGFHNATITAMAL